MKKFAKYLLILFSTLTISGCALPFQTEKYPAWKTKGLLESYTLGDGRSIGGWLGANIGDKITAKWYDFTINSIEEINEYNGYKAKDGKTLYHAQITITNTTDKDVYLFDGDFTLVWNLENEEFSYQYSMDAFNDSMLSNEMVIEPGATKTIDTLYEVDKTTEKPLAIYYYEQYSDNQNGNKYYVYIR